MIPSLSNDEIEDRYFLLGRMEILSVLNELIHRRESVTVYFNGGRDAIVTTLLEARPDALVFDLSGDHDANRKLPVSQNCVFVSRLNGIRVQFSAPRPQLFSWGGSEAFWVPLPDKLIRLQRRESYRILMPVAKPVLAKLYDESKLIGEWPVHDISVGGLGLNIIGEPQFEVGQEISRVHMPLMKLKDIRCAAQIRHVTHLTDKHDGPRYRIGLSFVGLPAPTGVMIQRYIIKIELARRGLDSRVG